MLLEINLSLICFLDSKQLACYACEATESSIGRISVSNASIKSSLLVA